MQIETIELTKTTVKVVSKISENKMILLQKEVEQFLRIASSL